MPITILPKEETGFERMMRIGGPYLEQAWSIYMQKQLQEQQRQKQWQQLVDMGLATPKTTTLTPQEQAMSLDQFNQYTQGVQAGTQKLQPRPKPRTTYKLNEKALAQMPGLEVPLGYGMNYKVPSATPSLAQQLLEYELLKEKYQQGQPSTESQPGLELGGISLGKTPQVNIKPTKKTEPKREVPAAQAGLVSLAKESINNIQKVRKILFPNGTPESFQRGVAFRSNLPGGSLPILPQRAWGQKEQDVFRMMNAAIAGRQLIQTGVAARPEETARLMASFTASGGSNPVAAFNALNDLENFYSGYINTITTGKIEEATKQPQEKFDFSNMSTEELLRRKQQLLQGGGK